MGKFRVGDRVRALQDSGLGAFLAGKEYEVLDVRYENITAINERGQRDSWGEHHFELLPVAEATSTAKPGLKIEAGKYYRTRDGRKVGPVTYRDGYFIANLWHYNSAGECGYEGRHDPSHDWRDELDLIVEWVDEPVKKAAPVAVQQDAPELTVKLSFDADDVTNAIKSTLLKTNQGYGFEIARHGDYVWVDTGKKAPIVLKATDVQAAA